MVIKWSIFWQKFFFPWLPVKWQSFIDLLAMWGSFFCEPFVPFCRDHDLFITTWSILSTSGNCLHSQSCFHKNDMQKPSVFLAPRA